MKLPDDRSLVSRLNKDDRQAFDKIYWIYHQPMLELARRYLKDHQLAEDAVQDVFYRLWIKRKEIDSERSLRGFLFTALRNHVLNMVKIHKRRILRQFEYAESQNVVTRQADAEVIYSETEKIVQNGIKTLPEGKKLVFTLTSLKGYSNQEVAEYLGISVHTVRSQFQKANKIVQRFVTRHID